MSKYKVALALFPLAIYIVAIFLFSSNMPFLDDYDATLHFLSKYTSGDSLMKWRAFTEPHNEHRLLFNHALELADLKIFGRVNFLHLTITGMLAWLSCILMLWRWAKSVGLEAGDFLPVILILTSFSHHEIMTWAMGGNQQYYQLLFCLLSILLATKNNAVLSLAFFVLAVFTGGGGFALAPCLLFYWLMSRRWVIAGVTLVVALFVAFLYFKLLPPFENQHGGKLTLALANPHVYLAYVLCFLGSAGRLTKIAVPVGLWMLISAWQKRAVFREHSFLLLLVMFVISSAGLAGLARISFGVDQARSSRYSIYSILLLAVIYFLSVLHAQESQERLRVMRRWLSFAVVFYVYWLFLGLHAMGGRRNELSGLHIIHPRPVAAGQYLGEARKLGLFSP